MGRRLSEFLRENLPEAIVTALLIIVLTLTVVAACERHVSSEDAPPRLNGQPLDAHNVVEYDKPVWLPECERCYRVIDRMTGQRWWLLKMNDGSWAIREDEQVDKQ